MVANNIVGILSRNGKSVTLSEAMVALGDFYQRLHEDILNYHGSTICEFLNNIRWGIHGHLQPASAEAYVYEGGELKKYKYNYPNDVRDEFARSCYWDLMDDVRVPPYIPQFKVNRFLKMRY